MPVKKVQKKKSEVLTKEFFITEMKKVYGKFDQIDEKFALVDEKFESLQKNLEHKIEASRQDAKEQLTSVARGINARIDRLTEQVEMTQGLLLETSREGLATKKCLDGAIDKIERHDEEIATLKSAVSR